MTEAQGRRGESRPAAHPHQAPSGKKEFVCFCEDVTVKDISQAVAEGFDDIQLLKRYSTATMGPCQGKMCLKSLVGLCAQYTGQSVESTGVTTARPPLEPVSLGALAGPSHMPLKRSPLDHIHRELGADMVEAGPWQRPHSYGSPEEECQAVRHRVGIIDVSTLGKLDIRGKDAGALLDRVYTHRFSNLRVGRIRYGVLCSDNGTILDDGTVARVSDDHFFVTTTSGNVDMIEEWFKWWNAGTGLCAHVTNVTSDYAAVNVAGPHARQTLAKLTDIDLSPSAFRYMRFAQGEIAGIPGMLLRIGFVGEAGWEVHVPAEYGEYLWEAIIDAGSEFGIAPFGLGGSTSPAPGKEAHHSWPGHRRRVQSAGKRHGNGRSASTRRTSLAGLVSSPFVTGDCATSWSASSCGTGRYLTMGSPVVDRPCAHRTSNQRPTQPNDG